MPERSAVCARRGTAGSLVVLTLPVLALVGGLAAACFAKVHGTVFLGVGAHRARRPRRTSRPARCWLR